jgi:CDP-archaeol synthase
VTPDPIALALFLISAFALAGLAQVAWLASPWSQAFAAPLDRGIAFRGRRLLGDNKTFRGFVVMIPATAMAFPLVAFGFTHGNPPAAGLWPLTAVGYAVLGAWAGLGFMLGELPNSFFKRQLGIAPGQASSDRFAWWCQFVVDRIDSGVGMLAAVSLAVPMTAMTWIVVLCAGPAIHWLFSVLMFHMGTKARPA